MAHRANTPPLILFFLVLVATIPISHSLPFSLVLSLLSMPKQSGYSDPSPLWRLTKLALDCLYTRRDMHGLTCNIYSLVFFSLSIIAYDWTLWWFTVLPLLESLRFRLVAYSRCASHGRSAPRCALRFRHFFNEGSGELEIWYNKLQVALYMRHIIYKIIFEANNYLGCKDESPATRPFPSQKGKCISYTQVCSPPCTKHLWYSIILSFHHSHSSV